MKSWRWNIVESMDSVDWNEQDGGVAELFGGVDAVDFLVLLLLLLLLLSYLVLYLFFVPKGLISGLKY